MHLFRALLCAVTFTACSNEPPPPLPQGAVEIPIEVDAKGYHPSEAKALAGQSVRLLFKRTSDEGCGQQVVFPSLKITKDLPLGQTVPVDVTMPASGTLAFACGMGMLKGDLVVE